MSFCSLCNNFQRIQEICYWENTCSKLKTLEQWPCMLFKVFIVEFEFDSFTPWLVKCFDNYLSICLCL